MQNFLHFAVLFGLAGLLLCAAISDMRDYIIPNWVVLAILLLYPLSLVSSPVAIDWPGALGAGFLVFTVGVAMFALGICGAGDAKLLGAVAVWAGTSLVLPFLVVVGLMGGVVGIVVLARQVFVRITAPAQGVLRRRQSPRRRPVPYGIAIAVGGLWLVGRLGAI